MQEHSGMGWSSQGSDRKQGFCMTIEAAQLSTHIIKTSRQTLGAVINWINTVRFYLIQCKLNHDKEEGRLKCTINHREPSAQEECDPMTKASCCTPAHLPHLLPYFLLFFIIFIYSFLPLFLSFLLFYYFSVSKRNTFCTFYTVVFYSVV